MGMSFFRSISFSYLSVSFHPVAECTHEFVHGRIGHSLLNFLRHSDPRATPTNGEAPKLNTNTEESEGGAGRQCISLSYVVSVSVRAGLQSMRGGGIGGRREREREREREKERERDREGGITPRLLLSALLILIGVARSVSFFTFFSGCFPIYLLLGFLVFISVLFLFHFFSSNFFLVSLFVPDEGRKRRRRRRRTRRRRSKWGDFYVRRL